MRGACRMGQQVPRAAWRAPGPLGRLPRLRPRPPEPAPQGRFLRAGPPPTTPLSLLTAQDLAQSG